jgi:hypothetical protein
VNNPLSFEQDPEAPAGTGRFSFQDGSSIYAMDPELAGRLSKRIAETAPPKLAQAPSADPAQAALLNRLQSGGAPPADPLRALNDAPGVPPGAPPPSGGDWLASIPGGDAGLPAKFQAGAPKAESERPIGPPLPPGGVQPPPPKPEERPPLKRPMVHVAGRDPAAEAANAVAVPTKASTTVERSGAPWSPEAALLREEANQGIVQAKLAEFGAMKARADLQRAQAERDLPVMQQQADEAKAAYQKKFDAYAAERDRIRQDIERFDAEAKVDPHKFWRAGFGTRAIGMIIGQALGAYAATLRGGDNFAQRLVEQAWKEDLEAQREEIRQGRIGQQNMLARLQDQLGDAQQAESAWKIMASEIQDRRIQAYAAEAGSQDALLAAQTWLAQNKAARLAEEQKFMDLSMGKQTTTTSADMVQPRRSYSRPMTDEELINHQLKRNKLEGDLLESENRLNYERRGGKHAPEGPDAELYVEGYGQAKSKKEAIALRQAIAEHEATSKELDRVEQLNKSNWSAVGFRVPFTDIEVGTDEYLESGVRSNRLVTKGASQRGGPITESDVKEETKVTPDPRRIIGNEQIKINSARETNDQLLAAKIKQIVSGDHPNLPTRRQVDDEDEGEER